MLVKLTHDFLFIVLQFFQTTNYQTILRQVRSNDGVKQEFIDKMNSNKIKKI